MKKKKKKKTLTERLKAPLETSTSQVELIEFLIIKPGEPVGFPQNKG